MHSGAKKTASMGIAAFIALLSALAAARTQTPPREVNDRAFQECTDCPVMVAIPSGKFAMGSPAGEPGRFDNEGPQHYVSVRAFALGKYEVTSEQFQNFLTATGYQPAPCNPLLHLGWSSPGKGLAYPPFDAEPRRWPAACLDWKDAQAYIAWLNGRVKAQHPDLAGRSGPYRLPSEAEWEYAARAGAATARWWGDAIGKDNADCNGCGSKWDDRELAETGTFGPNPFGLTDMLGTVWQWTADCWHDSYAGAPHDGSAWTANADCRKHVLRGGSWENVPVFVRSAARTPGVPDGGEYDYSTLAGFRVARDLP
jgi:formylglycine-generating enzyme required for sulfatase activity